jgi:hypothetical protein
MIGPYDIALNSPVTMSHSVGQPIHLAQALPARET